jgi:hypothetical protein
VIEFASNKKIVMMMMRKGNIIFYSQAAPAASADYDFPHHSNPRKTCNPQQTWLG